PGCRGARRTARIVGGGVARPDDERRRTVSSTVPERHPDQDQLADLAAEVLPTDEAKAVVAHVMGCTLCERLLADAERVRRLLVADPPGPMPDDVWLRLEGAMAAEAVNRGRAPSGSSSGPSWFDATSTGSPPVSPRPAPTSRSPRPPMSTTSPVSPMPSVSAGDPPLPVPPGSPLTPMAPAPVGQGPSVLAGAPGAAGPPPHVVDLSVVDLSATRPQRMVRRPDSAPDLEVRRTDPVPPVPPPSMSFDEAPTAAWRAFLDKPEPVPSLDTAAVPIRAGRVVRPSVRSRRDVRSEDKASGRRPRRMLLAAAAAVLVVGGGVGTTVFLRDDGGGNGGPGEAQFPPPAASSIMRSSGRDYTAATLVAQVKSLLAGAPAPTVPGKGSPTGRGAPSAVGASATRTAGTVADPNQLTSCLVGLGEKDRQPSVVDLARYQGREAAVIVLPGRTGGFDIWVVPRQCRAGAELPLAFKSVPK
ncbi:MAG TPA: hypothetical protein VI248_05020, partial [Kineosporiaceae bacterium]